MPQRFAIYFAPPADHPLWEFGSRLIGYDAATGAPAPWPDRLPAEETQWSSWTADPRSYGFHGTLKAPFRLADGAGMEDVERIAAALAARWRSFEAGPLRVSLLGTFVALVPASVSPTLDDLAADCVRSFEPVRAPLSEAERARRLRSPLSPRQIELLDRYGYPYVLDQFRFHMTLTGRLPPERAEEIRAALAAAYAEPPPGLEVASICVFAQAEAGERFRIRSRFAFG